MIPAPTAALERRLVPAPGTDLACWHRPGDGTGWVLWLHGAGGSHRMWGHQVDAFPGADLLFLDVRGQGESTLHAGHRAAFVDAVDDIPRVLDAYGVDRAVLVGHSWGGNPAQELAHRSPERVEALVLVGTWGQHRRMSPAEARMVAVMAQVYRVVPWRWVAAYSGRWASSEPATRAAVTESLRACGRQVYLDLGTSAYREVHEVEGCPAATPTLLIRGEHDSPKALGAIYADICAKNPAAREVALPGTGHQPMMDVPDVFNDLVADLLAAL